MITIFVFLVRAMVASYGAVLLLWLQVRDLLSTMRQKWPTLACPSSDGTQFWTHEWEKHGTCSESVLDQHGYFQAALKLKKQVDVLRILQDAGKLNSHNMITPLINEALWWSSEMEAAAAGIQPDGGDYSLKSVVSAISDAIGYTPWIECNNDEAGNSQLYQVYLCVDTSAAKLIECPVLPRKRCGSEIEFPSF